MIKRTIEGDLERWKGERKHKPLVLRGARQVGKTTVVKEFARSFPIFLYVNLDLEADRQLFARELKVRELFQLICLRFSQPIKPDETLLFIDEIQFSSTAIKMLRYFYEDMPELCVIAAGSLLEAVVGDKHQSFPVGRIENLWVQPLSFEEYLGALGRDDLFQAYHQVPASTPFIEELRHQFKIYSLLGGMPEAVARYLEHKDMMIVNRVYESLVNAYLEDVDKYADDVSTARALVHILKTAPAEAGKRITLEGFGASDYKALTIRQAFDKLQKVQLLKLSYPVTSATLPMVPQYRRKPRLQLLDTGLLNYQLGIQEEYFLSDSLESIHKGLIIQHIVGQELQCLWASSPPKLSFWVREKHQSSAEVDFVIPHRGKLLPIEVKSGSTGSLRSLMQFMLISEHDMAIRIHEGSLSLDELRLPDGRTIRLLNLPLCLSAKVRQYADHYFALKKA
ncbi:MAG: ATP-binding protein [Candidatus Cloacimonetes bacterium]|jgi:predicted AAA+ superfamily ATPase|nr:ATP-binding protein [Candidatus Cloacimonadota bacterium]